MNMQYDVENGLPLKESQMIEIHNVVIKATTSGTGYDSHKDFEWDCKFIEQQLYSQMMGWC